MIQRIRSWTENSPRRCFWWGSSRALPIILWVILHLVLDHGLAKCEAPERQIYYRVDNVEWNRTYCLGAFGALCECEPTDIYLFNWLLLQRTLFHCPDASHHDSVHTNKHTLTHPYICMACARVSRGVIGSPNPFGDGSVRAQRQHCARPYPWWADDLPNATPQ